MNIEFFVYISDIYGDIFNMKPFTFIIKEYYNFLNIKMSSNNKIVYIDNNDLKKVRNFCLILSERSTKK